MHAMSSSAEDPSGAMPPEKPQVLNYQTPGGSAEQWVTIFKARNSLEANLAVGQLQEKGFSARVDFENTAALGAWAGAGSGTVTNVQVLAPDAPAARAIIDEIERRKAARLEAGTLKCPRCGNPAPKRILSGPRIAGLALIALGIVLGWLHAAFCVPSAVVGVFLLTWPMKPKWRCRFCGHTWRAAEPGELDDEETEGDDDDGDANDSDDR
jgi:hypothetical protein